MDETIQENFMRKMLHQEHAESHYRNQRQNLEKYVSSYSDENSSQEIEVANADKLDKILLGYKEKNRNILIQNILKYCHIESPSAFVANIPFFEQLAGMSFEEFDMELWEAIVCNKEWKWNNDLINQFINFFTANVEYRAEDFTFPNAANGAEVKAYFLLSQLHHIDWNISLLVEFCKKLQNYYSYDSYNEENRYNPFSNLLRNESIKWDNELYNSLKDFFEHTVDYIEYVDDVNGLVDVIEHHEESNFLTESVYPRILYSFWEEISVKKNIDNMLYRISIMLKCL